LSYSNTTSDGFGFYFNTSNVICNNCTAYGNGPAGFRGVSSNQQISNCISVSNGTYGFQFDLSKSQNLFNNAAYNNTTANYLVDAVTRSYAKNNLTLTGDPFTNAAAGDFSLNSTAGAGLSCKAAGLQGTFPRGTSRGYIDIGAVQSQYGTGGPGGGNVGTVQ